MFCLIRTGSRLNSIRPRYKIGAFNASFTGVSSPLLNVSYVDLFDDTRSRRYANFNITAASVPPHGSKIFRLTAEPSRWIENNGTASKSWVVNSSGCV